MPNLATKLPDTEKWIAMMQWSVQDCCGNHIVGKYLLIIYRDTRYCSEDRRNFQSGTTSITVLSSV